MNQYYNVSSLYCFQQMNNFLGENWQKYMIRDLTGGGGPNARAFERASTDRSTLPMSAASCVRDRLDSRNFGYPPGFPGSGSVGGTQPVGGAVFVKQSHRAIITDLKNRSLRSGTAVAIDDPMDRDRSARLPPSGSGVGSKLRRDSDANVDRSMDQRGGAVAQGSPQQLIRCNVGVFLCIPIELLLNRTFSCKIGMNSIGS